MYFLTHTHTSMEYMQNFYRSVSREGRLCFENPSEGFPGHKMEDPNRLSKDILFLLRESGEILSSERMSKSVLEQRVKDWIQKINTLDTSGLKSVDQVLTRDLSQAINALVRKYPHLFPREKNLWKTMEHIYNISPTLPQASYVESIQTTHQGTPLEELSRSIAEDPVKAYKFLLNNQKKLQLMPLKLLKKLLKELQKRNEEDHVDEYIRIVQQWIRTNSVGYFQENVEETKE